MGSKIRTLSQLLSALEQGYTVEKGEGLCPPPASAAPGPDKAERHFCISVAGHVIGIDARYAGLRAQCRKYLSDAPAEFSVHADDGDIAYERAEAEKAGAPTGEEILESLAIYRRISTLLLAHDTFLMHGAVVAVDGEAYMFTAESGTGKTTHIRKWLENLGEAYVVNGDKPLIRIGRDRAIACGTPWCGKERMGTAAMVPLRSIVFLERAERNEIAEITFGRAFPLLLQQTYRPADAQEMRKTLDLLRMLKDRVTFWRFRCNNFREDCFRVAHDALITGQR